VVVSLFASCKKSEDAPPPPPAPRIKTVTAGTDVRTFFYDSKGRVTQIVLDQYGKQEFAYADTGVTISSYDLTGALQGKTFYKTGANGLAISATSTFSPSDKIDFSYNAAGQLLTSNVTRTLASQPTRHWDYYYYYSNSNLDSLKVTFSEGSSSNSIMTYYDAYYTDKLNTLGNENYGQPFLGASSKNIIKVARDIGSDNQGNMPSCDYKYEYDATGRITKQMKYEGTSAFMPLSFTYY
jgi:hypothetical protein